MIDAKEALQITNDVKRKNAEKHYGEIFSKYSDILIKIGCFIKENASNGRNSCKLEDIEEFKSFKKDGNSTRNIIDYLDYKGFMVQYYYDEHTVKWL